MEKKKEKVLLFGDDEKVAGVVAGVANYFNGNIKAFRAAYGTLTILTGLIPGILAYIALAFVMVINEEHQNGSTLMETK
ncbi:MAG: PspC domain-containing protein [Paludibacteraceae bacterium]|nr:PspC domain-containing protein [Paludibacteraceae bacterium]MBP3716957.1 PspC domain-containing protein [Paludibacteraceae bacterium]